MKVQMLITIDPSLKKRLDRWADFNEHGIPRPKRLSKSEKISRLIRDFLNDYEYEPLPVGEANDMQLAMALINRLPFESEIRSALITHVKNNKSK